MKVVVRSVGAGFKPAPTKCDHYKAGVKILPLERDVRFRGLKGMISGSEKKIKKRLDKIPVACIITTKEIRLLVNMKVTTKGHYGLHAMIELARKEGQGPVMIREMAKRQGISEKYLEQIMRLLGQAGLVESSRGSKGGFWLAKPATEIRALEVLETLERESEPALTDRRAKKGSVRRCAVLEVWREAEAAARCSWSAKSLADLMTLQEALDRKSGAMDYSI